MAAASPSQSWDELSELFAQLLDRPVEERAAFLAALGRERPGLEVELAAMLAAADDSQALELETSLNAETDLGATDVRDVERSLGLLRAAAVGERLGPYRLIELVARGGMGEVFLAERADGAFAQRVAVKLMRPGLDTVDLVARFALERDLLARLTHPSVVPLLDGGTTPEGRPYLVLQYVEGQTITRHCEERGLDRRARVRLFLRLCRAVQYAHSHLVVHRDLKPSNILVTPEGEVRLLDFGIAKLVSAERPQVTRGDGEVTRAELVPMTPERAAPEQKRLEPITTATDVWALGLLLHELLTGALPPGVEAGRPELAGLAARLGDRDLAAIVAQGLRPEPERRYATAGELAQDVERWLGRESVAARPDSFGYRLNRFVARHRGAVTVGTAALVALVMLALFSAWQSWRTARAQARAAEESAKATQALEVLVDLLGTADPTVSAQGGSGDGARILKLAEHRAGRLKGQPEIQARLRHALAEIYYQRGEAKLALPLVTAAFEAETRRLPEDDPRLLRLWLDYSLLLHANGKLAEARTELAAIALLAERLHLVQNDPALQAMVWVQQGAHQPGEEGERLIARSLALERAQPRPEPVRLGATLTVLAGRVLMRGDRDQAHRLFQESLDLQRPILGEDDPRILATESNLAAFLADPAARAAEHRRILARRVVVLGERSQAVATSWRLLGMALAEQRQWPEALEAFGRSRALWDELTAPTHPWALLAQRNFAWALGESGQPEAALAAYDELVRRLDQAPRQPRAAASYRAERDEVARRAGRIAGADQAP